MTGPWRYWVASGLAIAAVVAGFKLHAVPGRERELSFTLILGLAAGVTFQRSQFCFAAAFRDLYLHRDRRVMVALLTALVVGSAGYMVIFGAWVLDPSLYLPNTAHIAPLGFHLVLGGLIFGFGMVLGGGCITGHLFRVGEGSGVALVGLLAILAGYTIALSVWNPIYLNLVGSRELWLPEKLGYAGAFALQVVALATAAALIIDHTPVPPSGTWPPATLFVVGRRLFIEPWPAWAGGIVLGLIATFAYLRTWPLGVTEEIGRVARLSGDAMGIVPERLHGLDSIRGCAAVANPFGVSANAVFLATFVGGALIAALMGAHFRPKWAPSRQIARTILGGLLVGFGAMISLGCTVGTLMSGIMAFSMSGWIFFAALAAGAWLGTRVTKAKQP